MNKPSEQNHPGDAAKTSDPTTPDTGSNRSTPYKPGQQQQNPGDGAPKTDSSPRKSESVNGTPPYVDPDSNEPEQENGQQVSAKKAGMEPSEEAVNAPPRPAKDNDELMGQQQSQSMPGTDQVHGQWQQHVGAATIVWDKLTEDELLKLEGHEQKLAGLVQERYAITRGEADKQVRNFFEQE